MKQKLFRLFIKKFHKEVDELFLIEYKQRIDAAAQAGYDDAKEHYNQLLERQVANKFSEMSYLVNPLHVFQISPTGIPMLSLEPIDKEKARQLKQEAELIKSTEVWNILQGTVRQKAIDQALKNSTSWEHVLPGKMTIYGLDIQNSIVQALTKMDIEKLPNPKKNMVV